MVAVTNRPTAKMVTNVDKRLTARPRLYDLPGTTSTGQLANSTTCSVTLPM